MLSRSPLTDHFEKVKDTPAQKGSQIDERQYDKNTELFLTDDEIMAKWKPNRVSQIIFKHLKEIYVGRVQNLGRVKDGPFANKSGDLIGITPFFGSTNVIQQYPSCRGRTSLICIGICQNLDLTLVGCQVHLLVPTHELAQQAEKLIRDGGAERLGIKVHAYLGETKSVSEDQHVVVGTPGDVLDMIRNKSLRPNNIKMFVLDDADQMLSLGFKDQIYDIFQLLPSYLQLGVFTESVSPELLELVRHHLIACCFISLDLTG